MKEDKTLTDRLYKAASVLEPIEQRARSLRFCLENIEAIELRVKGRTPGRSSLVDTTFDQAMGAAVFRSELEALEVQLNILETEAKPLLDLLLTDGGE